MYAIRSYYESCRVISRTRASAADRDVQEDEKDYLESLNDVNYEKIIRKLVSIYLNEIMDHYNPLFSELNLKFYNFKYYLNKIRGMRNEITTEGDFKVINDLKNSVITSYSIHYTKLYDLFNYIFAIGHSIQSHLECLDICYDFGLFCPLFCPL